MHVAVEDAATVSDHVPGRHDLHAVSALADAVVEYFPATQPVHVSEPGEAHVPREQVPTTTLVADSAVSVALMITIPLPMLAVVIDADVIDSDAPLISYDAIVISDPTLLQHRITPNDIIPATLLHISSSDSTPFQA